MHELSPVYEFAYLIKREELNTINFCVVDVDGFLISPLAKAEDFFKTGRPFVPHGIFELQIRFNFTFLHELSVRCFEH